MLILKYYFKIIYTLPRYAACLLYYFLQKLKYIVLHIICLLFSFPIGDESGSDSNSNDEADDEGFDENSMDPKLLKKLKQVSSTFIQGTF